MDNLCIRSFLQETNLCHFSYWYDVWLVSQRYHLTLSFRFHSFHVTFIYTMNWMIFYSVWFVFLLFSFDVIIIAPPNAFVNTFLYFSHNYYLFHYLQYIYIVYFSYYILFSDNLFCSVFSFSSPYRSPFFPHTNKQTGHHSYRNLKYSWVLRYAIHA